ncbi:plasmid maintenance protein [Borreliella bissettiae]|uniref:plasmid maintenance protein n=1 Tax=Borrelia bissettiae TaxID=64897 RepID=UPI001E6379CC|nr:plasmid maintenance protein [Borreliella bissettiae]
MIDVKNQNYKNSCGVVRYSARDIYRLVADLLKKDGKKVVSVRTVQRDLKLLNEIGLIKTKLRRFGKDSKGQGSVAYYIQNTELVAYHKEIIWEYLVQLLYEKLENKKIVGDFDEDIKNAVFNVSKTAKFYNVTNNPLKYFSDTSNGAPNFSNNFSDKFSRHSERLSENIFLETSCDIAPANQDIDSRTTMSHHSPPAVFNKANISYSNYKNSKNSLYNSKIQKNNINFEKKDIETKLIERNIPKDFLSRIKDLSNNPTTYRNALYNLDKALDEHKESNLKYVLEHFLDQFSIYRYKVWMMMKRRDGVISDYEVIWKERFGEFVKKKVELNDYVKKVLSMEAREREQRSRERLERISGQSQAQMQTQTGGLSNNQEQDSVNTPPERIYLGENRNNIYGRVTSLRIPWALRRLKELLLKALELIKKQFKPSWL